MWYRDYRCKNWTMFKDYENNIQYGIDGSEQWYSGEIVYKKANSEYLASDEEIEKGLRKEAKRRGFVKGTKFLGCAGVDKDKELEIGEIRFYPPKGRIDWGLYCGDSWIYKSGKWGTVVEDSLLERLKDLDRPDLNRLLTWSGDKIEVKHSLESKSVQVVVIKLYFYHNSEKHGANFYELVKEIETKVNDSWKTFVIYKQLGSGLEFSREKEEFLSKFKKVYV